MRPSPQPSRFVHYLSHSSQTNKQATNKPTTAMSTANNTNYSPSGHNDYLWCVMCDKDIVRDSDDHDHCVLVNKGYDLICQDCPRKCKTECGECVVCEDPSESESEDKVFEDGKIAVDYGAPSHAEVTAVDPGGGKGGKGKGGKGKEK